MYIPILISSLIIAAVGFILTENNAGQLLAGYNTMSKEKQDEVDLKTVVRFFKKFHWFLGGSMLIVGCVLVYFFDKQIVSYFLFLYPVLAYAYFLIKVNKMKKR